MIDIVKLHPGHIKPLRSFFNAIDNPDYIRYFSPHPFNEENSVRVCSHAGQDLYYAVLLDGEKIIGYGMLRGWDEGYDIPAIGLCILEEYQNIGLGALLLLFLETLARARNCLKVMLKVNKDNEKARKLYETRGYIFKDHDEEFLIGYKDLTRI